ncbi:MAG: hypothetical protein E7479_08805 [Ruminococcaceae bacterium]|nr:hypothetical protein [Oscillospiraceae bacterium]
MTVPKSLPLGEGGTAGDEREIAKKPGGQKGETDCHAFLRRPAMTDKCHSEQSEESVFPQKRMNGKTTSGQMLHKVAEFATQKFLRQWTLFVKIGSSKEAVFL